MSYAAYAQLVLLDVVITEPGDYLTRSGEVVEVFRTSSRHDHECYGRYASGQTDHWHKSGRLYFGMQSANDIVGRAP